MAKRRSFGTVRQRTSGRWQASYIGPDGLRYQAPGTFDTKRDADEWLAGPRSDIARGVWTAPVVKRVDSDQNGAMTFAAYVPVFLATQLTRKGTPITDRTRDEYRRIFATLVPAALSTRALADIDQRDIDVWYVGLGTATPAQTANAYTAIKALFNSAIKRKVIPGPNPCQIQGGGSKVRESVTTVASDDELDRLYARLPAKYRAMALLCSWMGLRMGEVVELRRKDVDFERGILRVHRGVTHTTTGGCQIQATKGKRKADLPLLDHLVEPLRQHLDEFAEPGREGRLFAPTQGGCHVKPSAIYTVFYPARESIGRPDLRFHDLRHTALVRVAEMGATGAEIREFGRHATLSASERYQSVARGRMALLAQRLNDRAAGRESNVVDLEAKRRGRSA